MTLSFFRDNQELFQNCVLWYTGNAVSNLGFPILPAGVTVTPAGTWANDLNLGNNRVIKTFDGATNYISLTDNDTWDIFGTDNLTSSLSIAFWIKYSNDTSTTRGIVSQYQDTSNYWWVVRTSVNKIGIKLIVGGTTAGYHYSNTTITIPDEWVYFTVVKSGTSTSFYHNGIQQTSTTGTNWTGTVSTFTQSLQIGKGATSTYYHPGNLKDLMIYNNRALTQTEIITLMRLTNPNTGREISILYPGKRGVE